jgi:RHS repeat-associated protein
VLNLPDTIQFGNGRQIINSYDAGGHKLTTQYYTPIGTVIVPKGGIHGGYTTSNSILRLDDYFGHILYENGTSASVHPLTRILTPEGYIDMSTSGYPYCYYKQDHLGSNREVTSYAGTTGTVVQQTEYYPSGTAYVEGTGAGIQPFKFTGKELIIMHGLNWQDYGARWLDNVRMQWTTVDPLAEKYPNISPYAYCANNPIRLIDPDGRDWYINEKTGALYYNKNQSDQTITYKKQQYTKVGENDVMGKMGKTTEKNYNFKDSQKLANKNGFNINPVQEVQDKTTMKISDKDSPASIKSDQYKVVVEKSMEFTPNQKAFDIYPAIGFT